MNEIVRSSIEETVNVFIYLSCKIKENYFYSAVNVSHLVANGTIQKGNQLYVRLKNA